MIRKVRRKISWKFGGCGNFLCLLATVVITVTVIYSIVNQVSRGRPKVYDADGLVVVTSKTGKAVKDSGVASKPTQGLKCGVRCEDGQKAFYVKSGTENKVGATICYEGEVLISPEKGNTDRGLNTVFIDGKTHKVLDVKVFDTYMEVYSFMRYMKKNAPDGTIAILVSHDEVSDKLNEDGKWWLKNLGSNKADKIGFRDALFMIGQKGLKEGHAVEVLEKKPKDGKYAPVIEKKGCFSIPLGPLHSIKEEKQLINKGAGIKYGKDLENCGLKKKCDDISIMVHTGNGDQEMPKICVNGKMVMADNLNNAGRGFNIVVIDPDSKSPTSVSRFDTYESNSLNMEFLLENTSPGDIVVGVINDDGSRKLNQHAKETLNHLGSSMIQNLKFRDVWYFIGQNSINGFTLLEQISYAGYDGDWPKILKESFCVPKKVPSSKIPPSPASSRNMDRREFCKKYDGYVDFCDPAHIDETISTVELLDKSKEKDTVFHTPILIVPGMDHNAVVRTMETTLMQPGLKPEMVLVAFDEGFKEFGELATLFGFSNVSLSSSTSYEEQMIKAIEEAWKLFYKSEYMIVIEEELILASDFLSFMGHCITLVQSDKTLYGAAAWNFNGYETTSGDKSALYRVNEFPGLAFLLPKRVYNKYIKDGMQKCCSKRAWEGWFLGEETTPAILTPDVSRAYRQPYQSSNPDDRDLMELFHKPRQTNLDGEVRLAALNREAYDKEIGRLLENGASLSHDEIRRCLKEKDYHPGTEEISKPSVAIFFHQENSQDYALLRKLCKCFGLYYTDHGPPKNLYNGLLRFFHKGKHFLLVGSSSPYFKHKPANEPSFRLDSSSKPR